MSNWNKHFLALLFLSLLTPVMAQESESETPHSSAEKHWYAGVEGGIPFGVSTLSSFGADKTRAGFAAGLYGGYRFNPVVSLELSLKWGEVSLSAKPCCVDAGYWLGSDLDRYMAPVLGMDGWSYTDIRSRVTLQHYGLRLPVNVLGLFPATKQSRWMLELAPELSLVGTKASLSSTGANEPVARKKNIWHLGVGGSLMATYRITDRLSAGLYSGITHLTGKRMDGMPEHQHHANYLWENGIRIGWTFVKGKKKVATSVQDYQPATQPQIEREELAEEKAVAENVVTESQTKAEQTVDEEVRQSLPTIYFAFNSTRIAQNEVPKLHQLLSVMQEHAEVSIHIDGWCDTRGSKAVNKRISALRARTVKAWLVRHGIAPERITVKGCGSDYNQSDAAKARRCDAVHQTPEGKEEQE